MNLSIELDRTDRSALMRSHFQKCILHRLPALMVKWRDGTARTHARTARTTCTYQNKVGRMKRSEMKLDGERDVACLASFRGRVCRGYYYTRNLSWTGRRLNVLSHEWTLVPSTHFREMHAFSLTCTFNFLAQYPHHTISN